MQLDNSTNNYGKVLKYKNKYLLSGGADHDHIFKGFGAYSLSKVYKKLYKDLQTGGGNGEDFPRTEPHLKDNVIFEVKRHTRDGKLELIPSLREFINDQNITNKVTLKVLICVLDLLKNYPDSEIEKFTKDDPGEPFFVWEGNTIHVKRNYKGKKARVEDVRSFIITDQL